MLRWLCTEGCVLPASCVSVLESEGIGAPREWHVTVDDIVAMHERAFAVNWNLSWESPDITNWDTFDTLSEAYEFLGETGAMQTLPGNSGLIVLGSVRLYSTHFTSSGFDRGDSHIDPTMRYVRHDLFTKLMALEAVAPGASIPQPQTLV